MNAATGNACPRRLTEFFKPPKCRCAKAIKDLLSRFNSDLTKREVEEELHFHLELLAEQHVKEGMPWDQAMAAAQRRFGNVERTRDECVEISRRRTPFIRALKFFLILVFVGGILVRVFSQELHLTRVGGVLIAVAILGRLLIYVRGLNPSSFHSSYQPGSLLKLNQEPRTSFTAYDQTSRTPIERIIFDK